MNSLQFLSALEIGLIYGVVAMGVYMTFRIIDFPDLTVDGSFTLGACVSAALMTAGTDPYLATLAATVAGGCAGCVTGYLHVRWRILGLLAGILTMTGLYSINLRIMGVPNRALGETATVFGEVPLILVLCGVSVAILFLLLRFFASEIGLSIRALGINSKVSHAYGINVSLFTILTLALSNGLVAFAGSLFAQANGFADISMGCGTIIVGLASVIIGEVTGLTHKRWGVFLACILGSVIYRLVITLALNSGDMGLEASDLNLITALIIAFTMGLPEFKRRITCWN